MSLKEFVSELRRRGVLKTAAAYLAIGWVVLEGLSLLFQNFDAPGWVIKVVTSLIIIGFPVACLMSWGFDITREGVRPVPSVPKDRATLPVATMAGQRAQEPAVSPSIAVLPFVDMSAEHDQQYLGDGIAEELLNALAAIEGLNVAARTSSFVLAGRDASMKEIGNELNVAHVLEGSVRRSGQKLRVTAQLIDVKSGFHRFTQSYDREVQDIFAIQNDIAREIATALLPKLGLDKDVMLVKHGTANLEAYNLWLNAHRWVSNPDPKTFDTATEQLQRAVTLDPRYADAWGDLGYILAYSATWAGDAVPPLMRAFSSAERALALMPSNVSALLARAAVSMVVDNDATSAARYYELARVAGVDHSLWAFNKAYLLDGVRGHFDDAIANLRDAERSDPLALQVKWLLIEMQLAAGQIAEALATAEHLHQLAPRVPGSMAYEAYAYLAAGDVARAEQSLAELRAATSDEFWHVSLIDFELCAARDRREVAERLMAAVLRKDAEGASVSPFVIGVGYKVLGEYAQAIEWWQRALRQHHAHWPQMTARFRCHPVIGKDPRFLALLKRMGLEAEEKGAE